MKIEYSKWNLANVFQEEQVIEVHEKLPKFPKLYYPILKHELQHTNSTFDWKDLKQDLISDSKLKQWDLFLFMFHHPKTFTQLLPFYYSRKRGFHLDINMSITWAFLIMVFGSVIFFGLKYL